MVEALCTDHRLGKLSQKPFGGLLGCLDCGKHYCPNCDRYYTPALGKRKRPEVAVQTEFPDATTIQREQLLSGICSDKCWEEYLGPEPE